METTLTGSIMNHITYVKEMFKIIWTVGERLVLGCHLEGPCTEGPCTEGLWTEGPWTEGD